MADESTSMAYGFLNYIIPDKNEGQFITKDQFMPLWLEKKIIKKVDWKSSCGM